MAGDHADTLGLLIVDRRGVAILATGCAESPAICDALLRDLDEKRAQGGGVIALEAGMDAIAVYRAFGDILAFFVQPTRKSSTLFNLVATVDFADAILDYFLESPYFSMVVVDDEARVKFIPPVHEKFFGIEKGGAIGKHVTEVIENTELHEIVRSGKAEIGKLQKMGDVTRVVARIPIVKNGKIAGAIGRVMFKGPETLQSLSQEVTSLRSELAFYRREYSGAHPYPNELQQIVGDSDAIRQLKSDIVKVAPLNVPVLIIGESGTGKELAARAIHELSPRSKKRMVFVNAAALPTSLVESELFGYEGGAFTGAGKAGRKGKFEMADSGSLFFDEIGDMPIEIQVKLLRILQDGVYERLGGNQVGHSDFRLICASNRNFQSMIRDGQFRLDLYYRISGVTIRMPSLRERLDDIPVLVQSILVSFADRHRASVKLVSPRVYDFLREQPWPGNVRQLLHEVEKAAIFCDGPEISIENFRLTTKIPAPGTAEIRPWEEQQTIPAAIESLERNMVKEALLRHRGNKKKAAEELGISRAYLYKKLATGSDLE